MSSWKNNGYIPSGMNGTSGVNGNYQQNTQLQNNNNNNNVMYSPLAQNQQQMQSQQQPSVETTGPRAKCDQVVFEAIAKAAEIVVGSRCWIDGSSAGQNNNSSSRFNLFVPEVQGVRSILQRWKRALHVPLRLDVYYQHPDGQRQLLERWCLEYAPSTTDGTSANVNTFHPSAAFASPDPIVQLRQVCKNIVIWLRTLYCWSRMLPAQSLRKMTHPQYLNGATSPIGFCIYVVSEGQNDLDGLVANEGFSTQSQPHSVPTPYGELGWKVYYAPKDMVKQLMPEPSSPYYSTLNNTSNNMNFAQTHTQPIPMAALQQQQSPQTPPPMTSLKTARSAPQHGGHRNLYRRANSDFSSKLSPYTTDESDGSSLNNHNRTAAALPPNASGAPRSYHDRHLQHAHKAQSSGDMDEQMWLQHQQQNGSMQQQQQSNGGFAYPETTQPLKDGATSGGLAGTRNMSGLSLALMMSDEQSLSLNSENTDGLGDNGNSKEGAADTNETSAEKVAAAEKRRAALHSAPPQFTTNSPAHVAASPLMKAATATAGEYGYAYNNHIPTLQHQHPNEGGGNGSNPTTPNTKNTSSVALGPQLQPFPASSSYTTQSPLLRPMTPLGSTPPGYLLSATPSTMAPSSVGSGGLIPPRNMATPPFVRPMGFVGEAPSQPMPQPTEAAEVGHNVPGAQADAEHDTSLQQHQTSLDLLHSSPFQYPPSYAYSMHASSLQHDHESSTGAAFMSDYYHRSGHLSEDIVQGRGRSNSEAFFDNDLSDDMPFAVDPIGGSGSASATNAGSSSGPQSASPGAAAPTSGLASMMNEASLVASMCTAAPKRLAMFDSKMQEPGIPEHQASRDMANIVDSLADQLAEFKSFGSSINLAGSAAMGGATFAPEAATASAGSG